MKKFICIHGHFYQPPRENPWLEYVEPQPSATPYHNWNERINAECYAPNAAARITDSGSQIVEISNNYEFISFNFGPTLLEWLAQHDPRTISDLQQADKNSLQRLGHGNAIAQAFNHIIMPLASRRDKITQVKWGIASFEKYFSRRPEGMWLPETAVDLETLDILADEGIKFTILAPGQAGFVRADAYAAWQDVGGGRIDPKRPYFVTLPSGRKFALFFYDGPLSQAIAFEGVLNDGVVFANRIRSLLDPFPKDPQLVNMATDGESYGHHHRFGEMALAYAIKTLHEDPEVTVTNYAAYLAQNPPTWEVQIIENSSWSCAHGVERWRSDCGCGGHGPGWSLAWRGPLREAYDNLRDDICQLLESQQLFNDPWLARNDYINFLQTPPGMRAIDQFIANHQSRPLGPEEKQKAMALMEAARYSMYTFTSCGWFFDDVSGLEPVQNMRYAARAIELANSISPGERLQTLLATLEKAQSNHQSEGSGRDIWRRYVHESWIPQQQMVMEAVLPAILHHKPVPETFHCYFVEQSWFKEKKSLNIYLDAGSIGLRHFNLPQPSHYSYAIAYTQDSEPVCMVGPWQEAEAMNGLWQNLLHAQESLDFKQVEQELLSLQGWQRITLGEMSEESRFQLARVAFNLVLENYRKSIANVYDEARETMRMFREMNLPLPRIFLNLAETVIADEVITSLHAMEPGQPVPNRIIQLAMQAKAMGIQVNNYPLLQRTLEHILDREMENAYAHRETRDPARIELVNNLLDLAKLFNVELNLWRVQNTFHLLIDNILPDAIPEELKPLATRLGFAQEALQ